MQISRVGLGTDFHVLHQTTRLHAERGTPPPLFQHQGIPPPTRHSSLLGPSQKAHSLPRNTQATAGCTEDHNRKVTAIWFGFAACVFVCIHVYSCCAFIGVFRRSIGNNKLKLCSSSLFTFY